jgi:streptogrisin D
MTIFGRFPPASISTGRMTQRQRRALCAGIATVVVSVFLSVSGAADASPRRMVFDSTAAGALADRLASQTLGFYYDRGTGRFVFPVTGPAAAASVRAAGGVARIVPRGPLALAAVKSVLKAAHVADAAWGVDLVTDQVDLNVDPSLTGSDRAAIAGIIRRFGGAVHVSWVKTRPLPALSSIRGGEAVYTPYAGGHATCSLGFNVRTTASVYYFLTAGHCALHFSKWYKNSTLTTVLGSTSHASEAGVDYGVVHYTETGITRSGVVDLHNGATQDITTANNGYTGESVQVSAKSGAWVGTVTSSDFTTSVFDGISGTTFEVYDFVQVHVPGCVLVPGDSGGSLFNGTKALGMLSSGPDPNGNCYYVFQPVVPVIEKYGLNIY